MLVILIGPVAGAPKRARRFVNTGHEVVKKAKAVAAASAAAEGHSHQADEEERLVAAATGATPNIDEDALFWQEVAEDEVRLLSAPSSASPSRTGSAAARTKDRPAGALPQSTKAVALVRSQIQLIGFIHIFDPELSFRSYL